MSVEADRSREEQVIQDTIKQYYRNRPADFSQRTQGKRLPWEVFPSKNELLRAPVTPLNVERIQRVLLAAYGRQLPQINGEDCLPDPIQTLTRVKIIAVLRYQNQPDLFDNFLASDIWDDSLPVLEEAVSALITNKQQARDFFRNQYRATARNFNSLAYHTVFDKNELAPLLSLRTLGQGSYGLVDETENIYSKDRLARKIVLARGQTLRAKVKQEVTSLRKLGLHRHFVQLVGTYEIDVKYGLLFLPVADCNLYEYLKEPTTATHEDFVDFLLTCFGCLSGALKYMHDKGIRHKDVKPTNILVHRSTVLFTDFGLAHDYSDSTHTFATGGIMSTGTPEAFTRRYAAPEVLDCDPRNNKSDIFSLGCVFFEIWAALTESGLDELESFIQGDPDFPTETIYAYVVPKATQWAQETQESNTDCELAMPLEWCMKMMSLDQRKRPNISQITTEMFQATKSKDIQERYYCKHCIPGSNTGGSGKALSIEPSSEVLDRVQHNFSERQQADPREIYRALRQEAHNELENINQRRLEEVPNPPLFDAIRHGDTEEVRRLLDEDEVQATSECKGKSALHWAADNGFQDIAELLLDRGADIDGRDSSKMTALHWACFENHPEMVQYLLQLGADHDTVDQWGDSPLEDARGRYQNQVVALLEAADRKKYGRKVSVPETEGLLTRVQSMTLHSSLSSERSLSVSGTSTNSSSQPSSNTTTSLSSIAESFIRTGF
ncbi:hypothetical protein MMC18_005852 [Xylographa bjoerkii]|nr:hypothetical protein [Xylographa bjoerkii]